MILVGLSGYARSGKDEAAKVLVEEYGFERVAFADKLRDFLYALNPIVSIEHDFKEGYIDPIRYVTVRLRDVIDEYGWDGYKNTVFVHEIRPLLQRLGTEAGRQTLWDSLWIDAAFHDLKEDGKYVVTDARFPNEAEAIKERGGYLWRVERAGVGPALSPDGTAHASETSLDNWEFDSHIENNGSLEDYHKKIRSMV